jgi:RND family efflux transporter MFP subunit
MKLKPLISFLLTLSIFTTAVLLCFVLWNRYMNSPWTRDGRVRAEIINVAADVSGTVVNMAVHDNQVVRKGDLLFIVDRDRYRLALLQAQARLESAKKTMLMRLRESERRADLGSEVVSGENRENAKSQAEVASALYEEARTGVEVAKLNLQRTEVRSPVDGYITNLAVHAGDYVTAGAAKLALVDKNSFWVYGYFEENRLHLLRPGDPVEIRLMGFRSPLRGYIESVSRGITDRDNPTGRELLSDVNPVFNWVRLAQRVPVRVRIERIPDNLPIAAGMTCTVVVRSSRTGLMSSFNP